MTRQARVLALLLPALVACRGPRSGPTFALEGDDAGPPGTLVAFPSGPLTLHGYLYQPSGDGPFPAMVFNHGSEHDPSTMRGEASFFVPHGFVLFAPHRRGQGASADASRYIGDHAGDHARTVRELDAQTDDVMAAVAYVRSLPHVDPARVLVAGCSFGGIVSLFAAERGQGIEAVVDFAGGAMSWARSVELQDRMKQAARSAAVPVFFIQAANDFDTTPSLVLSEAMRAAGKASRLRIFPPSGSTHEDGHHLCYGGAHPAWGDDVLAFAKESAR
jgi:dienelactone hydrolase